MLNNERVYVEFVAKAYNVGDKEFVQCNIRDITQRKKGELHKKELEELKSNFIKIISHQLRTPLGAVRWNIEEFLSGSLGELTTTQQEILQLIYKANKEVIGRINDMLEALDIEEGRVDLEKSPTQLESLVKSVTEEIKLMHILKKIDFQVQMPSDLPLVDVDPTRIRDVLFKLVDNAITYTPEKGKVVIKISQPDDRLRVEVVDTGIGIPADEQSHLFERFHRASNAFTMKSDASGLGLYIAKHLIQLHGGTFGFESVENKGSRFWFELPLAMQTR
jgi:two-component system phosphate regulon sensor histidine kinase PhoR